MIRDEKEMRHIVRNNEGSVSAYEIKAEIALDIVNSSHRIRSSASLCIRLQFSARNYASGEAAPPVMHVKKRRKVTS